MRFTPWLAVAAAVAAVPALAHGDAAPGSIHAVDYAFVNADDPESSEVTIDPGETVTFSYPDGTNFHNVRFSGAQPTSCAQTAGNVSGAVPPLPRFPQGKGWAGTCRFDAPGTFDFYCELHGEMTGAVVVTGEATPTPSTTAGPTPTPTVTPTATPTATPSPIPTPAPTALPSTSTPAPDPPLGPAGSALKATRTQRGQSVKGSATVARAGSRVRIDLLAKAAALGRKGKGTVAVGSATKSAGAGRVAFTVKLNAAARKVLKRKGRLALTVRVTITPPTGTPFTASRTVTLRR